MFYYGHCQMALSQGSDQLIFINVSKPHRLHCFHFYNNLFLSNNTSNNDSTSNNIMMHGVRVGRSTDHKVGQ